MIVQTAVREVITEGIDDNAVQMRIVKSDEIEAHIVKTLTENYRFPMESSIREAVSNHLDSHIENGNPEHPIILKFYKNELNDYTFESSDQGLGLTLEEFDKYYMGIGQSSKRNKANLLGAKGLGCKAWLSLVDSYNVIIRKDNIEHSILIYKGELFPERTILETKNTTEPNGVTIKVNISRYDKRDFINAIKEQTCYFKTCFYQIEEENNLNDAKIYENELFTYSDIYPNSETHISFGPCHYPIEWKKLGIDSIDIPIGIKIPIDLGIDVHFNRESLVYNKLCIDIIKDKIKEISTWLINKYNEVSITYNNLNECWEQIDNKYKYLTINEQEFNITGIDKYSDIKFNNIKVIGINNIPLGKFKANYDILVENYKTEYTLEYGRFKSKYSWKSRYLQQSTVLLDKSAVFSPIFKDYLKTLSYTVFVKYTSSKNIKDLKYYKQLLELDNYPKDKWREIIKEWIDNKRIFTRNLIKDGTKLHISKEYLDFKEANKTKYISSGSVYNSLNKQKGEVTIHIPKQSLHRSNWKLEKECFNISKLHKQKYKFIILTEDQKELCKDLAITFKAFHRYKFVICTKGEIKKLPNIKNIIMFTKVQEKPGSLKLFSKIATAYLYQKQLDRYNQIIYNLDGTIMESFSDNLSDNIKKLEVYSTTYASKHGSNTSTYSNAFIEKCKEDESFDLTLQYEYKQLLEFNDKFSFLQFLKCDRYNKDEFISELNKQLLMRRLYEPQNYPEFSICLTKPVTKLEEV